MLDNAAKIISSRPQMDTSRDLALIQTEEEGGCGVTGFICSIPVTGKNIFEPSAQMHNRGNGKGGGIAAVGFIPESLGVTRQVLDEDYMLHIALLDPVIAGELESEHIQPYFKIDKAERLPTLEDHTAIGLEVKPPDVMRYFVRVKEAVLDKFIQDNGFESITRREAEDEFVYQNSFRINQRHYTSLGEKRAFVMSHGRDMMILKIVGYAENVVRYYKLDDFKAHAWVAHQRYPTRGRVWHPGGCHPFSALNEALVHNGDFANYQSIYEYLKQRNYHPLFLTDTEEAALLLDLWNRVYKYPLEYLIEAMAPTSEMDFDLLPAEKRAIYKTIQNHHIGASPDGPWFFIIARNNVELSQIQLIGITDTAMLRPQVFALQEGEVQIGLICSEKQAIDATLKSLEREDARFRPIADKYWNARGGSHTDGGAFIFSLKASVDGAEQKELVCTDKFGKVVGTPRGKQICNVHLPYSADTSSDKAIVEKIGELFNGEKSTTANHIFSFISRSMPDFTTGQFILAIQTIEHKAIQDDKCKPAAIEALTLLNDMHYDTGALKRSSVQHVLKISLDNVFASVPLVGSDPAADFLQVSFSSREALHAPQRGNQTLVVDAENFEPEGDDCDAVMLVKAFQLGWQRFIVYRYRGQRFTGCGFGPDTSEVRMDVYGSSGDYLASGIDGMEIRVHGNAQDQLGQIMKQGKLVVYGDVGQTFMYGAKGGSAFVMGNAAGRPLINAVGKPRVIINGTALDYLAESFMAGDSLRGGGFVILNGLRFDENDGAICELDTPYPGSNIFSLASGGAIYVRDPEAKLVEEQLNGGEFTRVTDADWDLIRPYLEENERLFNITLTRLLTVDGEQKSPAEVYRKIRPKAKAATTNGDGLSETVPGNTSCKI